MDTDYSNQISNVIEKVRKQVNYVCDNGKLIQVATGNEMGVVAKIVQIDKMIKEIEADKTHKKFCEYAKTLKDMTLEITAVAQKIKFLKDKSMTLGLECINQILTFKPEQSSEEGLSIIRKAIKSSGIIFLQGSSNSLVDLVDLIISDEISRFKSSDVNIEDINYVTDYSTQEFYTLIFNTMYKDSGVFAKIIEKSNCYVANQNLDDAITLLRENKSQLELTNDAKVIIVIVDDNRNIMVHEDII